MSSENIDQWAWWSRVETASANGARKLYFGKHIQIGPAGAQAIAEHARAGNFKALQLLHLRGNAIGPAGAQAIAERAGDFKKLLSLDLRGNSIGDAGAQAIAEHAGDFKKLTSLNLGGNSIGDVGAQAIAEHAGRFKALAALDLRGNSIGDAGAQAIAEHAGDFKKLTSLDLRGNRIGPAGAQAIAEHAGDFEQLTRLDLENNSIGDVGAQAIAEHAGDFKALAALDLRGNDIGDAGLKETLRAVLEDRWARPDLRLLLAPYQFSIIGREQASAQSLVQWKRIAKRVLGDAGEPLLEAKLLILGEGQVGKSHLRRRLFERKPARQPTYIDEHLERTHSVEHATRDIEVDFDDSARHTVNLRVWDFGGQPHLHASHRYFLSDQRGLYVLVADANRSVLDNKLGTWLRYINHETAPGQRRAKDSPAPPIIVVINQRDKVTDASGNPGQAAIDRDLPSDPGEWADWLKKLAELHPDTPLVVVDGLGYGPGVDTMPPAARDAIERRHREALGQVEGAVRRLLAKVPLLREPVAPAMKTALEWIVEKFATENVEAFSREAMKHAGREFTPQPLDPGDADITLKIAHNLGLAHWIGDRDNIARDADGEALGQTVFNPDWVLPPTYTLLWAKSHSKDGVLSDFEIGQSKYLLKNYPHPTGEPLSDWVGEEMTGHQRSLLLQLMTACGLCFKITDSTAAPARLFVDHLETRGENDLPTLAGDAESATLHYGWLSEAAFLRTLGTIVTDGRADGWARNWFAVKSSGGDRIALVVYRAQQDGSATVTITAVPGRLDGVVDELTGRGRLGPADKRTDHGRAAVAGPRDATASTAPVEGLASDRVGRGWTKKDLIKALTNSEMVPIGAGTWGDITKAAEPPIGEVRKGRVFTADEVRALIKGARDRKPRREDVANAWEKLLDSPPKQG